MTQLTPEKRERALDELRAWLIAELSNHYEHRDMGPHPGRSMDHRAARLLIRRIRALDQLRAESGLLAKAERIMRAGWQLGHVDIATGDSFWIERTVGQHDAVAVFRGPTLTAALKSAPEPER